MGFFDWIKGVGSAIHSGMKKLFGSQTGVLTPITNSVARSTTGGHTDFMSAAKHAISGGAVSGVNDFMGKAVVPAMDYMVGKARSIPVIGGRVASMIQAAEAPIKEAGDIVGAAKTIYKESGAEEEVKSELEKVGKRLNTLAVGNKVNRVNTTLAPGRQGTRNIDLALD
jgi:hypothetical protein